MATVEPGRRERKKRATRRHIAGTAVALFLARGFDAVTVAEIAEAADVSKVTVFNHFPAKVDMVFELADSRLAGPARAVRDRPLGATALEAVRDDYLQGIADHAEWTGVHDGIDAFVRMVWGSPTLLSAFGQRARGIADELAAELARAVDEPLFRGPPFPDDEPLAPTAGLTHHVVAAVLTATVQRLTDANVARMLSGASAAEVEPLARADAERAFALLTGGLGDYARRV